MIMLVAIVVIVMALLITTEPRNDFRIISKDNMYYIKRKYKTLFFITYWVKISYYMKFTCEAEEYIKDIVYFENISSMKEVKYNVEYK